MTFALIGRTPATMKLIWDACCSGHPYLLLPSASQQGEVHDRNFFHGSYFDLI